MGNDILDGTIRQIRFNQVFSHQNIWPESMCAQIPLLLYFCGPNFCFHNGGTFIISRKPVSEHTSRVMQLYLYLYFLPMENDNNNKKPT